MIKAQKLPRKNWSHKNPKGKRGTYVETFKYKVIV